MHYAGIGSRTTPTEVLDKMRKAARTMARIGFTLRSGGARGADQAFFDGHVSVREDNLQIFLPKSRFNGFEVNGDTVLGPPTKEARLFTSQYHPNWPVLGCLGRDFMARNAYQVLGYDLRSPSAFVLAWTPTGKIEGGTGQALRIAEAHEVPILNFGCHTDDYISDFILEQAERIRE